VREQDRYGGIFASYVYSRTLESIGEYSPFLEKSKVLDRI
jgi:hypothetical protein